tara:strand:- start:68 stop:355 length:288 start_codon:yes stop_codon:yes gene_type:complete
MKIKELKDKNNNSTELFKIEGFTTVNKVFDRLHKHFDMTVINEDDSFYTDETEGNFNYVYVSSDGYCHFVESLTEFSEDYQTEEAWQVHSSVEVN